MKRMTVPIVCLLLGLIVSGCITTQSSDATKIIAKEVTFTTSEPAPLAFDAWTFFWEYPAVERFDADIEYIVPLPNGKQYYVYDLGMPPAGGSVRSDFSGVMRNPAGTNKLDMVKPFQGKHISIGFHPSKGRIRFSRNVGYQFVFYKKDEKGKINWRKPFKKVDAAVE